jgi:hypothetical protein
LALLQMWWYEQNWQSVTDWIGIKMFGKMRFF